MEKVYEDVGVQIQGETTPKTTTSIDAVVKQGFAELQRIIQDAIETTTKATTTTGSFTMEPEITTTTSPMNLDVENNEDVEEYSTLFVAGAVLGIVGGTLAIGGAAYKLLRR